MLKVDNLRLLLDVFVDDSSVVKWEYAWETR